MVVCQKILKLFCNRFDRAFDFKAAVKSGAIKSNVLELEDNHAGAVIGFKNLKRGEQVLARVASSFISFEQAELNLKEVNGKTFDEIATAGKAKWNEVLGRIEVKDADIDRLKTFYSCLYRSTLFPCDFSEIDRQGNRVHYSPYNGQVLPGEMFTDTGFWDTFRSLFPLLNLVYPEMNDRMQAGLVNAYKESGFLPEWASPGHRESMIGNNSASIVADAFVTGRKGTMPIYYGMLSCMAHIMRILKFRQPEGLVMRYIIKWVLFPLIKISIKMWQEHWSMHTTIGVSINLVKHWANQHLK